MAVGERGAVSQHTVVVGGRGACCAQGAGDYPQYLLIIFPKYPTLGLVTAEPAKRVAKRVGFKRVSAPGQNYELDNLWGVKDSDKR